MEGGGGGRVSVLVAGVDGGASAIIPQLFRNCCGTVAQHLRENGGTATVAQLLRNCCATVPELSHCAATVPQLFRNCSIFFGISEIFRVLWNFPDISTNYSIFRKIFVFPRFPDCFGCETAAEQLRNSCGTDAQQ